LWRSRAEWSSAIGGSFFSHKRVEMKLPEAFRKLYNFTTMMLDPPGMRARE
jgi:hypothetical protein